MRRATTMASSVLFRTPVTMYDVGATIGTLQHRILQVAFYGSASTRSSCTRWRLFSPIVNSFSVCSARAVSIGVAGALLCTAAAASLSQEVYAKEPLSPELIPNDVVLYQYEACPFCNKVKAFLDYYDIPYKVVEVNPLFKKEIKWSDYKKVPILMVDGEQLVDSSAIIDKLGHKVLPEKYNDSSPNDDEEKKWRQWVDDRLVHVLSPNIYRNSSEALESFEYITSNCNFSFTEKITVKYAGAVAMYYVSKKLKKKYNITDERAALYEAADTWVVALNGREFLDLMMARTFWGPSPSPSPKKHSNAPSTSSKKRKIIQDEREESSSEREIEEEEEVESEDKEISERESDDEEEVDRAEEQEVNDPYPNKIFGGPIDPSVLIDFKSSAAYDIWNSKDSARTLLTCRHRVGRYADGWPIENEPEGVRRIVKKSGLYFLAKYPKKHVNKSLLCSFVERWYPETNTFHLPFGELTINFCDVKRILGIPIVGEAVISHLTNEDRTECYLKWLEEGLGIPRAESEIELKRTKKLYVELKWVVQNCKADDVPDEVRARGYLFHLLGCTIFNDKSGTMIPLCYLELLMDLDKISIYNWGAATLAYTYRQLGMASRANVKQIAGFLPLVETWIYDHFRLDAFPNIDFDPKVAPTINRWLDFSRGQDVHGVLVGWRERLDELTPSQVDWTPLNTVYHEICEISWYTGCVVSFDIIEGYYPERFVRQMKCVQYIPCNPPKVDANRNKNASNYTVAHVFLPHMLERWQDHLYGDRKNLPFCVPHRDSFPDYLDWFLHISHPVVVRPDWRLTGPIQNPLLKEHRHARFISDVKNAAEADTSNSQLKKDIVKAFGSGRSKSILNLGRFMEIKSRDI